MIKFLIRVLFSEIFILAIGLIGGLIIARYLGVEVRGEFGKIQIVYTIISSVFGLSIWELVTARPENERATQISLYSTLISLVPIQVLSSFFLSYQFEVFSLWSMMYITLNSLFFGLTQAQLASLQVCHHPMFGYLRSLSALMNLLGLSILLYLDSLSLETYMFAIIVSNIILFAINFVFVKQERTINLKIESLKRLIKSHLQNVFFMITKNIDKIFVAYFFDSHFAGIYFVSFTLAHSVSTLVSNSFRLTFQHEADESRILIYGITYATLLAIFLSGLIYYTSFWFIPMLLGNQYLLVIDQLPYLCSVSVMFTIREVLLSLGKKGQFVTRSIWEDVLYVFIFIVLFLLLRDILLTLIFANIILTAHSLKGAVIEIYSNNNSNFK